MVSNIDRQNIITFLDHKKVGAAPGTLYVPKNATPPEIDLVVYSPTTLEITRIEDVNHLENRLSKSHVLWVDVNGFGDPQVIDRIGELFHFHRLSLEDAIHTRQRPKMEDFNEYLFFVGQYPFLQDEEVAYEQIGLFVGPGYVVTFEQFPSSRLEPVLKRLENNIGRIRNSGSDYLAYAILDLIIDAYFPILEHYDEVIEDLETQVTLHPHRAEIHRIHGIKRDLLSVRKNMWGTQEALLGLIRDSHKVLNDDVLLYLRDVHDHCLRILDMAETYRDLCAGLMDFYRSSLSQRMNEIMKTLTIMATLFIPLTFIVGLYGMNFNPDASPLNMPELNWRWGYPVVLLVMLILVVSMLFFFRRKGWLGGLDEDE